MISAQIRRIQMMRTFVNYSSESEVKGAQLASPRAVKTTADHDFDTGLNNFKQRKRWLDEGLTTSRSILRILFFMAALDVSLTSAASGDSAKGNILYVTNCVVCHGAGGKEDGVIGAALKPPPADLTSPQVRGKSDTDLRTVIREGHGTMPAWKSRLNEQEIQNLIAYIRSLGE